MRIKFTMHAEWTEEVPQNEVAEIAEEAGLEGDSPTEAELEDATNQWIEDRRDELEQGGVVPTGRPVDVTAEPVP